MGYITHSLCHYFNLHHEHLISLSLSLSSKIPDIESEKEKRTSIVWSLFISWSEPWRDEAAEISSYPSSTTNYKSSLFILMINVIHDLLHLQLPSFFSFASSFLLLLLFGSNKSLLLISTSPHHLLSVVRHTNEKCRSQVVFCQSMLTSLNIMR